MCTCCGPSSRPCPQRSVRRVPVSRRDPAGRARGPIGGTRCRHLGRQRGRKFRLRLDGTPGLKNDLAGAGWDSLCVYTDGWVYPSASMAGVPELRCGDLGSNCLEEIWKDSAICRELRAASVEKKPIYGSCALKFLCGGGDLEHGYWMSTEEGSGRRGSFLAHDPYCDLYKGLADDALAEMVTDGGATVQSRSGFDRPVVLRGMGEHTLHDEAAIVRTDALRRACSPKR